MSLEIRSDLTGLRAGQLDELLAWIRSLGLNPTEFRANLLITRVADGYYLHLSRFLRGEGGGVRIDPATHDVASEPVVVDLGEQQTWPSFLGRWPS